MSPELPSPLQLVDAPELATLHVLETALAALERSLLAAYPELEEGLCLSRPAHLSTEAWLAAAIIASAGTRRARAQSLGGRRATRQHNGGRPREARRATRRPERDQRVPRMNHSTCRTPRRR